MHSSKSMRFRVMQLIACTRLTVTEYSWIYVWRKGLQQSGFWYTIVQGQGFHPLIAPRWTDVLYMIRPYCVLMIYSTLIMFTFFYSLVDKEQWLEVCLVSLGNIRRVGDYPVQSPCSPSLIHCVRVRWTQKGRRFAVEMVLLDVFPEKKTTEPFYKLIVVFTLNN